MVRVKLITRDETVNTRERPTDLQRVHRNPSPALHPFERPREYVAALNAVKLQRVFAKPFLGDLQGHLDGVYTLLRHPTKVNILASGACDGGIRVWNITSRKANTSWDAHSGFVRGICFNNAGDRLYSCGSDQFVKLWNLPTDDSGTFSWEKEKPIATWSSGRAFLSMDHQRKSNFFGCTSSNVVSIYDPVRSEPKAEMKWGEDSLTSIKFNPVETSIFATTCQDRSICFYDLRANTPIKKLVMDMRSNALAWNPMQAYTFTLANEDHNCYTFDMRTFKSAKNVHMDHVSAVLSLDYSPTGQEFVTGSYDKTLRIFPTESLHGHSREVYHTKRMQRIFTVQYSGDANYVFCGSDDCNIRIWKADASRNLEIAVPRQDARAHYEKALVDRYKHMPEIRRIDKKRHVPKAIKETQRVKGIMKQSERRKKINLMKHSKSGVNKIVPERQKHIVETID